VARRLRPQRRASIRPLGYLKLEPSILLRCLYLVADRKRNPWFVLIEKMLFRVAFAGFMVVEFTVFVLLLWAASEIVPDPNYFLLGILIVLVLSGPFLIGACSYLVFQRMTRVEYLRAESERWLAERRHPDPRLLERRKTIKKWAVWIPTAIVILTWVFLDEAWSFASHVLYPHSGKLIGYQVSIPLTWTIPSYTFTTYDGEYAHSIVVAERYRGLSRAWSSLSVGGRPSFSTSTMNFRSTPAGDPLTTKPASTILSTGTLPFGNGTITCREEAPPRWMTEPRYNPMFHADRQFLWKFQWKQ